MLSVSGFCSGLLVPLVEFCAPCELLGGVAVGGVTLGGWLEFVFSCGGVGVGSPVPFVPVFVSVFVSEDEGFSVSVSACVGGVEGLFVGLLAQEASAKGVVRKLHAKRSASMDFGFIR